jgi:hypothetical protein
MDIERGMAEIGAMKEQMRNQLHTYLLSLDSWLVRLISHVISLTSEWNNPVYLISFWGGGEVRLSPFGTSATNWPIVADPDDR